MFREKVITFEYEAYPDAKEILHYFKEKGFENYVISNNFPELGKAFERLGLIRKYQDKLSGPLLDRIDMLVTVSPVSMKMRKSEAEEETSETIRKRVEKTRMIQRNRYQKENFSVNAHLTGAGIEKYCRLSSEDEAWLENFIDANDLSYRSYVRILKLARTIADMDESDLIEQKHLMEAVMLRMGWNQY